MKAWLGYCVALFLISVKPGYGLDRVYQGTPANFNGTYVGPIQSHQGYSMMVRLKIVQTAQRIQLITVTDAEAGPGEDISMLSFVDHDIQGNLLFDTTTDHARIGEIDGTGFYLNRPLLGAIVLDRNANAVHVNLTFVYQKFSIQYEGDLSYSMKLESELK